MGNVNKVQQRIEQEVTNDLSSKGTAVAETECDQIVELSYDGVDLKNCGGINVEQNCKAFANVTMNSMVTAIQDAKWKGENKQVAKGIAFQVNGNSTKSDSITKAMNKIKSKCKSKAYADKYQTVKVSYKNMTIDCTDNPGALLQNVNQYGNTEANCMMSQILENFQKYDAEIKTDQKNEGLDPTASGLILLVLMGGVFLIRFGLPGGGNRNNND
tara:strand:- start:151 stop:795 length:645 start_codon:yes stop_codon:yes gene_type:complete